MLAEKDTATAQITLKIIVNQKGEVDKIEHIEGMPCDSLTLENILKIYGGLIFPLKTPETRLDTFEIVVPRP